MKSILLLPLFIVASLFSTAQVGIRTAKPTADLHIVSNPTPGVDNYNGIIIPKVKTLPVTGTSTYPKVEQAGLLIYLDAADATKGVYIFDGTKYIKLEPAAASGAFYNNNTTDFATTTTANVQRTGNVSLGSNLNSGRLNVEILNSEPATGTPKTGLRIANFNKSAANEASYGIFAENGTASTNNKVGLRTDVTGDGIGTHIGYESNVTDAAGNTINYGIKSKVGPTDNNGSTAYGVYSEIGSSTSRGTNYALYAYSNVDASNPVPSYSGYFRGNKFAIRSADDATGYDLPVTTGTAGQVLTTNGDKTASWTALAKTTRIVVKNQEDGVSQNLNKGPDETEILGKKAFTSIIAFSYVPLYTSSSIIIEADFDYSNNKTASGIDTLRSNITVGTTEIMQKRQLFNAHVKTDNTINSGGGNRSSSLTPIMGKYLNTGTSALSININFETLESDDTVTIHKYRTLKITEIPN